MAAEEPRPAPAKGNDPMTESDTSGHRVVGGRYELGDLLGRGGMAEVRRAIDRRLGRAVAVKQLRTDLATDPTFQARFRREAQSAAGLNHPNIVAVYDTGEEPDPATGVLVPYIVMELVEGPTLRDVLREDRKILPERALELTVGVLDALTYSHRAGIVHRDIKPANVMLTHAGNVKVMNIGIARAVADTSATMTQTAAVIGTAQYLSPEQARGETVDARSDLYSAGCLLYELLVGRPPFTGESPVSVAYQHVREAPIPPSQVDPSIPHDIDTIVLKSLEKEPDGRYQSAREMKADINRVLAGEQVTTALASPATAVRPPIPLGADADATRLVPAAAGLVAASPSRMLPGSGLDDFDDEPPRKRRTGLAVLVTVLILLVLAALGAGGYYWWQNQQQPQAAPPPTKITVPSVLGMDRARAESEIKSKGLVANITSVNGADDGTKNTAVKQDPTSGTKVNPDSTVKVEINVGPKQATIPGDLVGKKVKKVESELENAGFDPSNITRQDAQQPEPVSAAKGEVLAVDPDVGTTVAQDTKITLTVATGKSEVPNLMGKQADAAEQDAEAAGFKAVPKLVINNDNPAGIVIAQSYNEGALLDRGTTIVISVAKHKPTPPPTTPTPPAQSSSPSSSASPSSSPTAKSGGG